MNAPLLLDCMRGRDNNLHLLRMVAATMVLVSHSFAISRGSGEFEPWRATYGTTPGTVAVEIFFVVSGMLLTYSLLQRRSISAFARARILRIYPGLLVAVALSVFVLGPLVTTTDLGTYFTSKLTWKHLLRDALAFVDLEYALPGVFEANPLPKVVNGSLWTLPLELRCYAVLLGGFVVATLLSRRRGLASWHLRIFEAACLAVFAVSLALRLRELGNFPMEHGVSRLFLAFSSGSAMCIFGHRLRLHGGVFAVAVAAIVVGAFVPRILPWTYTFTLPYVVAWLAYVPANKVLRAYNHAGDYSYGTYIYAFPAQQTLAHALPGIGPIAMMLASGAATLALAVASWHWVEKPASRWRGFSSRRVSGIVPADRSPGST